MIANPNVCQVFDVPLHSLETVNNQQCFLIAQMEIAKPDGWLDHHKGWQIKSVKCGIEKKVEKDMAL